MLSVLLCSAAIFAVTSALPTGAPGAACPSVTPGGPHLGANNATPPNPWIIDVSGFMVNGTLQYTPNVAYTITLMQRPGVSTTLRGFLVTSRMVADGSFDGTFTDPSASNNFTRLSLCNPNTAGVTHNNNPVQPRRDESGPFTFTWTAPAAGTGPVEFRYAIVQALNTWWANNTSGIIQEAGNINSASNIQGMGFWTLLVAAVAIAIKTVV